MATGWGNAQTVSIVYVLIGSVGGYNSERRRKAGESERRDVGEGDSENKIYAHGSENKAR